MKRKRLKILIFGIFLIIIIFSILIIGNPKGPNLYNLPNQVIVDDYIKAPINFYNYKDNFLILSGWESFLSYGKVDRILGSKYYKKITKINGTSYITQNIEDRIIFKSEDKETERGFFFVEEDKQIIEKDKIKTEISWINDNKNPQKIGFIISTPSEKNYFKINLFVEDNNQNKNLDGVGYGLIINNYNIYLPNGTILKNDYEKMVLDESKKIIIDDKEQDINNPIFKDIKEEKIIELKGTNYKIITERPYQMFYNNKKLVIIYAHKIDYVENLFKWEVFRFWISEKENRNTFAPLYIAILNDAKLEYKNNTWMIQSKEFNGDVETLIRDWMF